MRELILLLVVLFTVKAQGGPGEKSEKKLKLAPPGQKAQTTEDPGSATRLLYEDPRNQNSLSADAQKKAPANKNGPATKKGPAQPPPARRPPPTP